MEEILQFEMLQPRWFSIFEIDVDIKTCDCIASHVVVPGAHCAPGTTTCTPLHNALLAIDLSDGNNFTTMEWLMVFVKVPL